MIWPAWTRQRRPGNPPRGRSLYVLLAPSVKISHSFFSTCNSFFLDVVCLFMASKKCISCGFVHPLEHFRRDRRHPEGRGPYCSRCACEKHRQWREKHPARIAEYMRRYWKTPGGKAAKTRGRAKRRGLMAGAECTLTAAEWTEIKSRYMDRCVYCGKKPKRLTQDHVVPISKGGDHSAANVVPACHSCNCRKRTKNVDLVPKAMLLFIPA